MSEAMMPISTDSLHHCAMLFGLSKLVTMSPKTFDKMWPMLIRFIQSSSKSCYKLMVQYAFRNMSADFGKARSQVQLKMPMARSLNVGIAVFEMPTFAMSE